MRKAVLLLAVGIIVVAAAAFSAMNECLVSNDTTVSLNYVVGYYDGSRIVVLSTNVEDIAKYAGIYNPFSVYAPITGKLSDIALPDAIKAAVAGASKGDAISGYLPPGEGFPEYNQSLVLTINTSLLSRMPVVGEPLRIGNATGRVVGYNENITVVDFNSELAGRTMLYRVDIVDVKC